MKHTKGEWTVDQESNKQLWICGKDEICPLAQITQGEFENGTLECTDEQKANAKLIATAPDLLKVCQMAMASDVDGSFVAAGKWWNIMKDTIKKASG